MMRVLLIGATGAFGERLARGLTQIPALDVVLTSRSPTRAQTLVDALRPRARCAAIAALAFTRTQDDARTFETLRPWLVIDASGPFQSAGYGTARAAIEAGMDGAAGPLRCEGCQRPAFLSLAASNIVIAAPRPSGPRMASRRK